MYRSALFIHWNKADTSGKKYSDKNYGKYSVYFWETIDFLTYEKLGQS